MLNKIFLKSYQNCINRFSERTFVSYYSQRNENLKKTFREFNLDVLGVTCHLIRRPENTVVLVAGNTYEHLVYITAIWLSGKTHCSINPDEAGEYLEAKLKGLGADTLVFSQLATDKYEPMVVVPSDKKEINLPTRIRPMNYAFTSGSTGYSKVVPQVETAVMTNALDLIAHHQLGSDSVLCTPLPVYHVNALNFSFLCCLLSGAKFVFLEKINLLTFSDILLKENVQVLSVVPQIISALNRAFDMKKITELKTLKYVITAAAPLSNADLRNFYEKFNLKIIQGYGLSEAVNFSCKTPIDIDDETYRQFYLEHTPPSIGLALQSSNVQVLDENFRPIEAEDSTGQIGLAGKTVLSSYLNTPRDNIFKNEFFLTGDMGYFKKDKQGARYYFISGRIKEICKRNGLSLSLREVDDLFSPYNDYPVDFVAVSFDNNSVGEELGLAVSVRGMQNFTIEEFKTSIEAFMKKHIPSHLQPRVILLVDQEIRGATGKTLRWKLKDLFAGYSDKNLGVQVTVKRA